MIEERINAAVEIVYRQVDVDGSDSIDSKEAYVSYGDGSLPHPVRSPPSPPSIPDPHLPLFRCRLRSCSSTISSIVSSR